MKKNINIKKTLKIISIILMILLIILGLVFYFKTENIKSMPTNEISKACEINEKEYSGNKVYIVSPKGNQNTTKKTIIYFHGGSYMAEMTEQHWNFIKQLVLDTNITVIVPVYPIAPKYCYNDTINFAESVYKDIVNEKGAKNIIAMGDSAGGGLILSLEEKISEENIELPGSTILISPWLDVSMSNGKISKIQKYDNDLNKEKLLAAGILYSRGIDTKNYLVSPLYGDLSKLKNITILTGTYDILNPDTHLLAEKASDVNVNIVIKEYEKANHIWIINKNCDKNLIDDAYKDLINLVKNYN